MKLVQINDAHIRGSSPKSRIDDFPETLWNKFIQLGTFIKQNNISAVLNGGDLFDTPDPATGVVNKYVELFASWDVPIYSIVGSHDKFGYNDSTIGRTALGTLIAAGIVKIIDQNPIQLEKGCSIAGISHSYSLDENSGTDYYCTKANDDFLIQLSHGMITEGPFYGKYTVYSEIKTEADLVICGHYHPGFKPHNVSGSTIINIGSMGRTENTSRAYPPGFLFIDTSFPFWEFHPFDTIQEPFLNKVPTDPSTMADIDKFIIALKEKIGEFEQQDLKELILAIGKDQNIPLNTIRKALQYIETDE